MNLSCINNINIFSFKIPTELNQIWLHWSRLRRFWIVIDLSWIVISFMNSFEIITVNWIMELKQAVNISNKFN